MNTSISIIEFQVQGAGNVKIDPNSFQNISKNPLKHFTFRQKFIRICIPELKKPQPVITHHLVLGSMSILPKKSVDYFIDRFKCTIKDKSLKTLISSLLTNINKLFEENLPLAVSFALNAKIKQVMHTIKPSPIGNKRLTTPAT